MGSLNLLVATDLFKFFRSQTDETVALRGVSLAVLPGEFVALVGASGSGKSTFLSCVAGLVDPDGGSVTIGGEPLSHRPEPERARVRARRIGMIFQTGNLIDHLTVRDNVRVGLRLAGVGEMALADEALEGVGMSGFAARWPSELSGGEAVRVAVAIALAKSPDLIIGDEPTGELDGHAEGAVLGLLGTACSAGSAVLVATHSPRVAEAAHRVIKMRDGEFV